MLIVTGHGGRPDVASVVEAGVPLLEKPFTLDALARRVREVLDAPPPPR